VRRSELTAGLVRGFESLGERLGTAHYGRCRIVQLVRETGGQLSKRDELLVPEITGRELPRAIYHRMNQFCRDHRTLPDHLGQYIPRDDEHLGWFLDHYIVWR
jgi:hypothetical protein